MPAARVVLLMSALLLTAGCFQKKQAIAVPPPPQPVVPVAPQIPPLSIPQTQVQLPGPQPVDPRALATIDVPAEPLPPDAAPSTDLPSPLRRHVPPPATAAAAPVTATAPPKPSEIPAAPVEEIPVLQERLTAGEENKLKERVLERRREAQETMNQFRQPKSESERVAVGRIKSFLDQAEQAMNRRDIRQADELSELAVIVARELKGAK